MVSFESQKLARPLILLAIVLFLVQIIAGLFMAWYQVDPHLLAGTVNFNVFRAIHLNALLLWIFSATFAAVIYIVPLFSGRDLPGFARVIPPYFWIISTGILVTLPLFQTGFNIWAFDQPLLVEGREWVEAGRLWDILLFAGFVLFAIALLKTLPAKKKWNIPVWAMVLGVIFVVILYVPGNIFFADVPLSEFFRWWTIHYWVENVLEVAYVGAIGLLLIFMIPSPRIKGIVEKYVFYDVILAATAGVIGNGHHYFWIGTPTFWILFGGLLGVLEIVPLILMILDSYRIASRLEVKNMPSFYFLTGIATLGYIGPALFGLAQTWPWTNWWEHGTWITAAHGHLGMLAFGFGAISLIYFMTPELAGRPMDQTFQRYGKLSFWFLFTGMLIQAGIFAIGGTFQVFDYRVVGMDWRLLFAARSQIGSLLIFSGTLLFTGFMLYAGTVLRHLYVPAPEEDPDRPGSSPEETGVPDLPGRTPAEAGRSPAFLNTLDGLPGVIVLALIFSTMATTGLWSFSAGQVLNNQDPAMPFLLSVIGYGGMLVSGLVIALKLIRGVEQRNG